MAAGKPDSCTACHAELEGDTRGPAALFREDVHFQRGLTCVDCHGGDAAAADQEAAMDPKKGYTGVPARKDIPQFCARCHADPSYMRRYNPNLPTDQFAKYLSSAHGKGNAAGQPGSAMCSSCHGAHGIRSKKDPFSPSYPTNIPGMCAACHSDSKIMEPYHLPVTQHWEYVQSVHGQALLVRGDRGAPSCASCHGAHEAAKPGALSIGNVCAQCHALTSELFAHSPHKAAHEALGLRQCEVCHGNHLIRSPSDAMLGTGPDAVCVSCHEPGTAGYVAAQKMRGTIESLKDGMAESKADLKRAGRLGMDTGEGEFALNEAATKLTQARTYVHSFSMKQLGPIAAEGMSQVRLAQGYARRAIEEFGFRRKGLWAALAVIALLVVLLILKIRDIDRNRDNDEKNHKEL